MIENKIFTCQRCGFCCHGETTVSLNEDDQVNMLKLLKISRQQAIERFWVCHGKEIQMKTINGHCIFYDNGCTVHKARPLRCREWPLVGAIVKGKENLQTIRDSCPGMCKTASYEDFCREIRKGGCLCEDDEKI